ncbi:MAG: phosphoadenylyl-sulfate reductase [Oceanicaulis sp.]|nr:phosphoadenylyl-sulfate reductase [Oceanicaulis sp.]
MTARPTALHIRALAARKATAEALAAELNGASPETILTRAAEVYGGRMAMLSSFGAEAALGLALVAKIASDTPILFLDTGLHFPQTLRYRDHLVDHLGLSNLQVLSPEKDEVRVQDPDETLYDRDGQACCDLRKVRPLGRALDPYDALITGRKRYHGGQRGDIPAVEFDGERVKINPFAFLNPEEVSARYKALDLPGTR